jgi:hypothetical protein
VLDARDAAFDLMRPGVARRAVGRAERLVHDQLPADPDDEARGIACERMFDMIGTAGRPFVALCLALWVSSPAWAAPRVTVRPDRILTGHGNQEFIPRFVTYLPNALTVAAGETVELSGASTYDAIEVGGTLRCSGPITLLVTHLTILPGGTFECQFDSEIVFRNLPIDITRDPYQFGNGLINMGRLVLKGKRVVTTFVATTAADLAAGLTVLQLQTPTSWRVGDEVLLPDFRQMAMGGEFAKTFAPRRESRVRIAAIGGTTITLSKPLDFAHGSIRKPDGTVVFLPRIANLTRDFVIRSESPTGTRGHVVMFGHDATWDVQNISILDVGRTRAEQLDSTTATTDGTITHVGTNQVGKYSFHAHHTQGFGTVFRGNVMIETAGIAKWAHTTHGTHDSLIEDNISMGHIGAGFVTEDGNEVRNVYRGNVAAYHPGNGRSPVQNLGGSANAPGAEGAAFWFHGMHNIVDNNEAWNNRIGVNLFYTVQTGGLVPSTPGGHDMVAFDHVTTAPISFDQNKFLANYENGFETWGAPMKLLATNTYAAYNGDRQVSTGSSFGGQLWLKGIYSYAQPHVKTWGVETNGAYLMDVTLDGGEILGSSIGLVTANRALIVRDMVLQNVVNIDHIGLIPASTLFERVLHVPLEGREKTYLRLGADHNWAPPAPVPTERVPPWTPAAGSRYRVIDWQRTGNDYLLYHQEQQRSKHAFPSRADFPVWCPVAGITMGECWDRYGVAYGGGIIADADAVRLEGIEHGVARAGLVEPPLPQPRTVVTFPSAVNPAPVSNGQVTLWLVLTGSLANATNIAVVQIDGGPVVRSAPSIWNKREEYARPFKTAVAANGAHTVVTWREDKQGAIIPASRMEFTFFVGTGTPTTAATNRIVR